MLWAYRIDGPKCCDSECQREQGSWAEVDLQSSTSSCCTTGLAKSVGGQELWSRIMWTWSVANLYFVWLYKQSRDQRRQSTRAWYLLYFEVDCEFQRFRCMELTIRLISYLHHRSREPEDKENHFQRKQGEVLDFAGKTLSNAVHITRSSSYHVILPRPLLHRIHVFHSHKPARICKI